MKGGLRDSTDTRSRVKQGSRRQVRRGCRVSEVGLSEHKPELLETVTSRSGVVAGAHFEPRVTDGITCLISSDDACGTAPSVSSDPFRFRMTEPERRRRSSCGNGTSIL